VTLTTMNVHVRVKPGEGPDIPDLVVDGVLRGGQFAPPRGTHVDFRNATLKGVSMRNSRFFGFGAFGSTFVDCDFSGSRFETGILGHLPPTTYRGCRFDGSDLRKVDPFYARFEECSFVNVKVEGWLALCTEFVKCLFAGPIVKVNFSGTPIGPGSESLLAYRRVNEFRGNDFRRADLVDTSFMGGIDLGQQLWPEGKEYIRLSRIRERILKVRPEVARWADDAAREPALQMLRLYESRYRDQQDVFTRRNNVQIPAAVRDRVWRLLVEALPPQEPGK
jgi:uncharacterized protein YjbI with pentapeptide repeats